MASPGMDRLFAGDVFGDTAGDGPGMTGAKSLFFGDKGDGGGLRRGQSRNRAWSGDRRDRESKGQSLPRILRG